MKLMNVTVPAGQSIEYAVPPSTFFYLHALGTAGALSVKLFGRSGDLIANLPLVAKGVRYRTSDAAEPFRSVTLKNVTQAEATAAFYVGMDEIIPPLTVTGGGGGTTSEVSADFARGLNLYSAELDLTTTATNLKAQLPNGATVSDWAVKVSDGTVIMSATAAGAGMSFEVGKGLSGSNSYPLYLRAETGTAKAQVMASYKL